MTDSQLRHSRCLYKRKLNKWKKKYSKVQLDKIYQM